MRKDSRKFLSVHFLPPQREAKACALGIGAPVTTDSANLGVMGLALDITVKRTSPPGRVLTGLNAEKSGLWGLKCRLDYRFSQPNRGPIISNF